MVEDDAASAYESADEDGDEAPWKDVTNEPEPDSRTTW